MITLETQQLIIQGEEIIEPDCHYTNFELYLRKNQFECVGGFVLGAGYVPTQTDGDHTDYIWEPEP